MSLLKKNGISMATKLEADPFIKGLGLVQIEKQPLVYEGDQFYLVVTGIGKVKSALATFYLADHYKIQEMFNLGAAGALRAGCQVGEIKQINKVVEIDHYLSPEDQPKFYKPDLFLDFPKASLVTQDRPAISLESRKLISFKADLVDMEGAAFLRACRMAKSKAYIFKIISDTLEHHDNKTIIKNIKDTSELMFNFFKEFHPRIKGKI